jgi:hypothetical protein
MPLEYLLARNFYTQLRALVLAIASSRSAVPSALG